jgi:peptide/nickel transport system permease protein
VTRYILKRCLHAIPLLWGILTLIFVLLHAAPGTPFDTLLGPQMPAEVRDALIRTYGLDEPLAVQYVRWLSAFVRGEWGVSLVDFRPVSALLAERVPNTLLLSGLALLLIFGLGVALGVLQAVKANSWWDRAGTLAALFLYSMPSFWLAIMLVLVFSYKAAQWPWFPDLLRLPASGMTTVHYDGLGPWDQVVDRVRHLLLPVVSLALASAAGVARYARGAMLEVIGQDYVRTARAKGLPERAVLWRHAFRNALIPVCTLLGLYLPFLLGGAVLIEKVFAWPGMGLTIVNAILMRDYPVVMATSFLFSAAVILSNLVADILYAWADPRIRYE